MFQNKITRDVKIPKVRCKEKEKLPDMNKYALDTDFAASALEGDRI